MIERAPASKRKASSPASVGQSSTSAPVAPKPQKRPRKSNIDTSETATSSLVAICPQPPWTEFPGDPFNDLLCDVEDDDTTAEETSTKPSPTSSSPPPRTSALSLYSPALAPDPDIPQSDLPYISFFLAEMSNVLPYVNLFPSTVPSLFASS